MFSTFRVAMSVSLALCGALSAATTISSLPYTISAPGSYVLNANLSLPVSGAARSAIRINASNVVLDLNGYGISQSSAKDTGVLINNQKQVVVKNGTINGFFMGLGMLNIQSDSSHRIQDLRLQKNLKAMLVTGVGHMIRNISITAPSGYWQGAEGILLSSRATVLEDLNLVGSGSGSNGIHIWGWNNRIRNSTFSGWDVGVLNDAQSSNARGNVVESSHFSGNAQVFSYSGSPLNTGFFNNYLTGNTENLPPYGIPGAASNFIF
jgi:hypothetical protein